MTAQFSIITATFNCRSAFEKTAQSLEQQTCRDFEWIVMDGGSTDGTAQAIASRQDQITSWVSESDRGIAHAWNKGLTRACGNHVLLLNAGDTYAPHFLERLMQCVDGEHIVCAHARLVDEEGRPVGVFRSQPDKLGRAMHVAHNWCAVPLRLYRAEGDYPELRYSMDFDWFHRVFVKHGLGKFRVLDEVMGDYSLGGVSDKGYRQGFLANEDILVRYGTPRWKARLWRVAYTANHFSRRWLRGR